MSRKIVGVMLVKNEDRFIERVLRSVVAFCDEILVWDNNSTDNTFTIAQRLSKEFPKIKLTRVDDALSTHALLEPYVGTDTWVFGVDGDEIYDAKGLSRLRGEIARGDFREYWQIRGNCLHCVSVDFEKGMARGYMAPPARPITKLFNFSLLDSWSDERAERLHGAEPIFKRGIKPEEFFLCEEYDWDTSYFRCLHLVFMSRSTSDAEKRGTRFNPTEVSKRWFPLANFIRNLARGKLSFESSYKLRQYKVGQIEEKSISAFL